MSLEDIALSVTVREDKRGRHPVKKGVIGHITMQSGGQPHITKDIRPQK
jgi:hypothetical protein